MASLVRLSLLSAALAFPVVVTAQGDQGLLIIRQAGQEIGRETFRFVPRRNSNVGDSLTAVARFPSKRGKNEVSMVIERLGPSNITMLLNRQVGSEGTRVLAAVGRNRMTVRIVGRGGETAREYPAKGLILVLDDSVFAPYALVADLVQEGSGEVTAIFPRSGRQATITVERLSPTAPRGDPALQELRLSGQLVGSVFLDQSGELVRVVLPEAGLEATRVQE
jgi:hypothetical protein